MSAEKAEKPGAHLVALSGSQVAVPEVDDGVRGDAERILNRVIELRDVMQESYFEMGRLLFHVSNRALYRFLINPKTSQPYQDLEQYVEEEVGFRYRKAQHLISIWVWFSALPNFASVKQHLKEIGWTKTGLLVGVADEKSVEHWIEVAREMPAKKLGDYTKTALEKAGRSGRPRVNQLRAMIAEGVGGVAEPSSADRVRSTMETESVPATIETEAVPSKPLFDGAEVTEVIPAGAIQATTPSPRIGMEVPEAEEVKRRRRVLSADMDEAQYENVQRALVCAHEVSENKEFGQGVLLDYVATHFLAFHSGAIADNPEWKKISFRNEVFASLSRCWGVDLVVLKKGTDEVIYGEDTVRRIESQE